MIPQVSHRSPRPAHGSADAALVSLASCVLVVDGDCMVTYANASAAALFSPLAPVGFGLRSLLSLSGASRGRDLEDATRTGALAGPVRVGLPDGRTLDCRSRRLADGGAVIALLDVTSYMNDAEFATRDQLTGLVNRSGLHRQLAELLLRVQGNGTPLAVLCIDLDRFKRVNDTLGHPVGDELLAKVAERLLSSSRAGDVAARLSGDEFAVIQVGVPQPQGAETLAARIVDLIGRTYVVSGNMITIGASVGIAISGRDGTDSATLLKNADLALYRAKGEGKGTFRLFQPDMDAAMQMRRLLETELRCALALRQFEVAYQPQVELGSDVLTGFEALLRWHHPERGFISPADFLPLAEEIGLIEQIGEWVLRTACLEASRWPSRISIAVNVSPMQFGGTRLQQAVTSALANSGLAPERLELEITEGALLHNTDNVLDTLHSLKKIGIRISMDDFGTGYSSLSYLQKFPFDKVKIDQSFVRGADAKPECGAIIRAVAALGASLGLKTTAEGVETIEQLDRIRAAGCTEVQGYLTGRPLPPDAATALVRAAEMKLEVPGEQL